MQAEIVMAENGASPAQCDGASPEDMEPQIAAMLDRKAQNRSRPAYAIAALDDIRERLQRFIGEELPGARVENVHRLGGGGSKEQFRFSLADAGERDGDYVLRMDPYQAVVETDRQREFELLRAMQTIVPVPAVPWVDPTGERLGRPSLIMGFCNGVVKPSQAASGNVTGVGLVFGQRWRAILSEQFLEALTAIHAFDWRAAPLPHFSAPLGSPTRAALWHVNWWFRVWDDDKVAPLPIASLTRRWLLDNLPECYDPVLVHGDFRSGNFLFDEDGERITAILDWELAHIGDHHEDIAWILQSGSTEDSIFYYSGLFQRDELIARYETMTGRTVNPDTLKFYEVLNAFKCLCITMATGLSAARDEHSHQDILLTWMSAVANLFRSEICRLLGEESFA